MNKVKLITEISKSAYDTIMARSVLTPNEAAKAIDAILNSTPLTESDDCVSRQAVMELLNKRYCHKEPYERKEGNTVYKGYDTYYMINFDKLKALPSVLPKRKKGEWIQNGTGYDDEPIYECSQCGKRVTFWEDGSFKGCPYCFAEMR